VPRVAGVVLVLGALDPHGRLRKEIGAVDVIPVCVRNDHVGHRVGLDAGRLDRGRGSTKVPRLPLIEELLPVEARIDEHGAPVRSFQQPHHHRNVDRARSIRARDESRNGKR
jgi:hypothetical protein